MKIQRPFWMWPQRPPQIRDAAEGRVFVDAAAGRKHLKLQRANSEQATWARVSKARQRQADWCADMDALYREHPGWSKRRLARTLAKRYRDEGRGPPPAAHYLENLWRKPS